MHAAAPLLPEQLSLDDFRTAEAETLRRHYAALFRRIREREPALCVFAAPPDEARVLAEVEALLARFPDSAARPPLFAVPFGVKDIFRTEGYAIHCGSLLPADIFAGAESPVVRALRQAGAVVMGITASTEFAHAEPAATVNPINPAHTPGGSSSGSAAGVRAGFFPLALGTQTLGSVIRPAAYCGVAGFKPSHGSLSCDGIICFSPSVDQAGFFCSNMADIASVSRILLHCAPAKSAPAAWRVGIPEGPYLQAMEADALHAFRNTCTQLRQRAGDGLTLVPLPLFTDSWDGLVARHAALTAAELAEVHREWFPRYRPLYRPRTRAKIEEGQQAGAQAITQGRASCLALRSALHTRMASAQVDALLCPSATGEAPSGLDSTGNPIMALPWTHAGLPALTLPCGTGRQGLPLGMQIVARHGAENTLLQLGAWLEAQLRALGPLL